MDDQSPTTRDRVSKQFRAGLQLKSVLILALVVVGIAVGGGWFYFDTTRQWLRDSDRRHAGRMCEAMGLAAQRDLLDRRNVALQRLVSDYIATGTVRYVAILDADGQLVASASAAGEPNQYAWLINMPVSVSTSQQLAPDVQAMARPIVASNIPGREGDLVGAARIVLDTSATQASLVAAQRRVGMIASAIVLCAMPLGYLLVWRLMVQPTAHLVRVTRRLAGGDYSARAEINRTDELGELGAAFDHMAGQIAEAHQQLRSANERLEEKVAQRTGELEQANGRLREEMVEKEDFLRAVSHDLNAPLRNIAGMATLAMVKWRDELPEEVIARLQRIQANVDAEQSLIADLLELSRVKSRPQKREVVDFGEMLTELAGSFEYELTARNIDLAVGVSMPWLYVEKNRMRQVFQNLIDNAIKYMDRETGGRIDVGYRYLDHTHQFTVADNGPGIAPEDHQRVFYVFRRCENEAAAKVQGKGVGLALVKTVASNYEGRAWVASELGDGATFHFTLADSATRPPTDQEPDWPQWRTGETAAAVTPEGADAEDDFPMSDEDD